MATSTYAMAARVAAHPRLIAMLERLYAIGALVWLVLRGRAAMDDGIG
jgi:hypothetical protein